MHTYLRFQNGTYTVGQWLPNHEGVTSFNKMFDVPNRANAVSAVNTLNGGDGDAVFAVTKEH